MNRIRRRLFTVTLLLIINAVIFSKSSSQVWANANHLGDRKCENNEVNLKAGHKLLTKKNFKNWKESNKKLAIIGVSDATCDVCCHTEPLLEKLTAAFDAKKYTGKKGKMLQIGRLDVADRDTWNILTTEEISPEDTPAIYVLHDNLYYKYPMDRDTDLHDITPLLHFIDRLEQPLLPLNSEEDIKAFLASENEPDISKSGFLKKTPVYLNQVYTNVFLKTRVLIFMFDKSEYEKEMKDLRTAARLGAQRLGLRYGLVTDTKLIRKYKAKYGNKWFHDEVQLSTVIIQRFDKETFAMDLMVHDGIVTLTNTVNRKSLMPV